ncbi:MAG: autotransporter-associated beta strand repeat-containing protein [bacterium]|nr:autotransporter-associated beta strand repeat-containing protein [bacterium]
MASPSIINNGTLIFFRSDDIAYSAVISGSGTLVKHGAGTLTLSASNTYSGPTLVSNGLLRVNGFIDASSALALAPGASLGGTGLVCAVTVYSNGRLDPGLSIGSLRTANLTMNPGSRYTWEFNSTTSDWIAAQALSFPGPANSITVTIKRLDPIVYPVTRTLFTFTSFDPATTNRLFFDMTDPSMDGIQPPTISTSPNAVLITLIPEPASLSLLLFAAALLRSRKYVTSPAIPVTPLPSSHHPQK